MLQEEALFSVVSAGGPSSSVLQPEDEVSLRLRRCCLCGSRLFVAIATFGAHSVRHPTSSASRGEILSDLLVELDGLRAAGVLVDVLIDATHQLTPAVRIPPQLRLRARYHNLSIGFELAGAYRTVMMEAVQSKRHDWYLVVENDLQLTASQLQSLCAESQWLARAQWSRAERAGPGLMAGLMRYETVRGEATRYLSDIMRCCPPHVEKVVTVQGRLYVAPRNGYAAHWLLPAARLAKLMRISQLLGDSTWQPPARTGRAAIAKSQSRRRGAFAGGSLSLSREWYAGRWLASVGVVRVVPLQGFERHLVHHATDAIIRDPARRRQVGGGLVTAEEFLTAARRKWRETSTFWSRWSGWSAGG